MILGIKEQLQVTLELVMAVAGVAPDDGIFECPVYALDLTIGPRMAQLVNRRTMSFRGAGELR
jgi:hypothetical protein